MLTSACTWHYYRHLIILVIGFRCSTQVPHFTAPFMPHMTLLGFMCPGLGNFIRSQVLSHHTINKPHDMLPLSHSLSPDQLPLLCTPLVFTTHHAIYGAHATTSTPTVAFVLTVYHLYIQIKGGQTEYTPPYASYFMLLPHAHTYTLHCACTHTSPLHPPTCLHT